MPRNLPKSGSRRRKLETRHVGALDGSRKWEKSCCVWERGLRGMDRAAYRKCGGISTVLERRILVLRYTATLLESHSFLTNYLTSREGNVPLLCIILEAIQYLNNGQTSPYYSCRRAVGGSQLGLGLCLGHLPIRTAQSLVTV